VIEWNQYFWMQQGKEPKMSQQKISQPGDCFQAERVID
jgi:hypothetical protein